MFELGQKVKFIDDEFAKTHGKTANDIAVINYIHESSKFVDLKWDDHDILYVISPDQLVAVTNTTVPVASTAVSKLNVIDDPQKYIISVQFISDMLSANKRTYEYYAFGTFEELSEATHVVLTKLDHTDLDGLLEDTTLAVARVLNVYPTSQQRYSGKLRWIVDFVDGRQFVDRNDRDLRTTQLRKDIKKRLEEVTEMRILEEKVKGDPIAEELYKQLKELNDE